MTSLMKIAKIVAMLVLFSFLFNGCALILKGTSEKVDFNSDPSGAKVYVNGQLMGTTPVQLQLKSNKTYSIEFRKDGYESKVVNLDNGVSGGFVILDILFGLVPVIFDAATGAWLTLDQDHVNGVLEKK